MVPDDVRVQRQIQEFKRGGGSSGIFFTKGGGGGGGDGPNTYFWQNIEGEGGGGGSSPFTLHSLLGSQVDSLKVYKFQPR